MFDKLKRLFSNKPKPNSLGEVETVDMLQKTPNTGGDIADPPQIPVSDEGDVE